MANLWIQTEERPKKEVISNILKLEQPKLNTNNIKIVPRISNGKFKFIYDVYGVDFPNANNIYIKTVSGNSSFFDFILFLQDNEPDPKYGHDNILYVVEETKTNDQESRNTGVYQRASKFVYVDLYYPGVRRYMLYNNESDGDYNKKPSDTNIFGTNMLLTIGVHFFGKNMKWFKPFENLDDLIDFKSNMRKPPEGNVPIEITKYNDYIEISGRLSKPADKGNIGHDPNIGALSIISKTIRHLGWNKRIIITQHGVSQEYINKTKGKNKFLYICQLLNLEMKGLVLPKNIKIPNDYWKYEENSEKIASIFTHVHAENHNFIGIYENHAGCERGYFWTKDRKPITLPKKDSHGNNLYIPDLILYNEKENLILLIEGKQYKTLSNGLKEIKNFDSIEKEFINLYYPGANIQRWITLFGGTNTIIPHEKVLLQINKYGDILINEKAPQSFKNMF